GASGGTSPLVSHRPPGGRLSPPSPHCPPGSSVPLPPGGGSVIFWKTAAAMPSPAVTAASVAQVGSGLHVPTSASVKPAQAAWIFVFAVATAEAPVSTQEGASGPRGDPPLSSLP